MSTQAEAVQDEQTNWFPEPVRFPAEHLKPGDDVGAWAGTYWINAPLGRYPDWDMRRHRSGCAECAAAIDADMARDRARKAHIRSRLTQEARELADRCRWSGLAYGQGGVLRVPASWPLPGWLHEVLAAGRVQRPQSEWPELCEVASDADWAALVAEHPDDVVMVDGAIEPGTASWDAIAHARQLLADAGYAPSTFVSLDVQPDGRIGVWPWLLCTDRWEGDTALDAQVTQVLAAGGRDLEQIGGPCAEGPWERGADWQVSG